MRLEYICCAEVTRKKASPKQALYCQSTDSVSFFIFKKTDICSLVQIWPENNSPFLFHVAFFCASLQPARQPPLVPPWEASQQENKSLGPPEGIRGSGYALGEPPTPGPSRAGGPSDARQCSSVKTKHSAGGKQLKISPTSAEIKLLCQEDPKRVQTILVGRIRPDTLGLFSPQCCLFLSCFYVILLYFGVICVKLKGWHEGSKAG